MHFCSKKLVQFISYLIYITRPQSKGEHGIYCELKVIHNLMGIVSSKLKADRLFGSKLRQKGGGKLSG